MAIFKTYFKILRSIMIVCAWAKERNFANLVASVESRYREIAPTSQDQLDFFIAHAKLWKFHTGFRRNMCLYYAMICLAYELSTGADPEVNVCISMDKLNATDGHCWLTRNGEIIYPMPLPDEKGYEQMISKKGRIRYWLRKAIIARNVTAFNDG